MSRSLGIVLQYSYSGRARSLKKPQSKQSQANGFHREQEEICIASPVADMFGFGLVGGGDLGVDVPHLKAGSRRDIATALDDLDASADSGATLRTRLGQTPGFTFRMGDLVALTTPMAHHLGSSLIQVPSPSGRVHGFTTSAAGHRAFRNSLQGFLQDHSTERAEPFQEEETTLTQRSSGQDVNRSNPWPMQNGLQVELVRGKCDEFRTRFPLWESSGL